MGSGVELLLCYFLLVLIGIKAPPRWSAPFLFIAAFWCSARIGVDSGLWSLSYDSWETRPNLASFFNWAVVAPGLIETTQALFRIFIPFLVYARFYNSQGAMQDLGKGVAFGFIVSLLVLISQVFEAMHFPNQTPFWEEQNRYASSFADPNAAGIFAGVFLPVLIKLKNIRRIFAVLSFAAVLTVGLMSGSRTFIVALFLAAFFRLPSKSYKIGGVSALIFLVVGLNAFQQVAPKSFNAFLEEAPSGISRSIKTLAKETSEELLFSRRAFLAVGTEAWLENPVIGIGPGQFFLRVTEFAERSGVPLGLWKDNPNNFYLGILIEFGLLGALLFLLMVLSLKFKEGQSLSRESIIILAVLLFFGPHLEFDEVSILAGFLIADGVRERGAQIISIAALKICGVLIGFSILASTLYGPSGLYAWEKDGEGFYRWTGSSARFHVPCDTSKGIGELELRNALPGGAIEVVAISPLSQQKAIRIIGAESISFVCSLRGAPLNKIPVTLIVKNPWVPLEQGMGNDKRLLGVQVRMDPLKRYD